MKSFAVAAVIFISFAAIVYSMICFIIYPVKYKEDIQQISEETSVNPALIAGIIKAESNFKPETVSNKGAVGLMQLMPSTAEYIAKKHGIDEYDLKDPHDNIRIGTLYLDYLLDKFSDVKTSIMAYNAGEGNVTRWLDGGSSLETTPFPETNAYTERVLNAMNMYKNRI